MIRLFRELVRLLRELKRRNVYRVAAAYLAVAFVSLQTVDLLIPNTTLPDWVDQFLLALLVAGFPISVVLAWAFELTPEGSPADRRPSGRRFGGRGGRPNLALRCHYSEMLDPLRGDERYRDVVASIDRAWGVSGDRE